MKKGEIRFNLFFWGSYFLYEWLGNASVGDEYYRYFINAVVLVPLTLVAAVFTVHFLYKRYFLKEKKKSFWWLLAISLLVFTLLRRTFNYYYTYPLYFPEALLTMPYLYWPKLLIEAVNMYLIVGLYAMFYFVRELYKQQQISDSLRQNKVETELKLLKSQVQPHFIFNTLNNIYSLAKNGHAHTAELIYRLSAFLSYNLYDSRQDTIPATQELEYVRHYVELEKIRHGDSLDVSINVFDALDGYRISPMLFLPLVENAFKHGVGESAEGSWIRIDLSATDQGLTLKVENSLPEYDSGSNGKQGGIGLANVRKRLEIVYPGNHNLQCLKDENSYLVILRLKLTRHGNEVHHSG